VKKKMEKREFARIRIWFWVGLFVFAMLAVTLKAAQAAPIWLYLTDFTGGEYSELMGARADFRHYSKACSTLENFLVWPHGPVTRRPGFRYVAKTKYPSKQSRLIPFTYSTENSYVIELGDQYARFYREGGAVHAGYLIEGENEVLPLNTKAEMEVEPILWKPFDVGANSGLTAFCGGCGEGGTGALSLYNPAHSGNLFMWTTVSGVTPGWLYKFQFLQRKAIVGTYGVVYWNIFNMDHPADNGDDWGFGGGNITGSQQAANDSGGWAEEDALVESTFFLMPESCSGVTIVIGFYRNNSAQNLKVDNVYLYGWTEAPEIPTPWLEEDLDELSWCQDAENLYIAHPDYQVRKLTLQAAESWQLSTFSPTNDPTGGATGYPRVIGFYESRLVMGASEAYPQRLFLSRTNDPDDFTFGTSDDDAIDITINLDRVNDIQWISPGNVLAVGTSGAECRIGWPDTVEPLTPTNIFARRETNYGSAAVQPVRAGHSILFAQRSGRKLRELTYNWEVGGYVAPDISLLNRNATESGIKEIVYQQEPLSVVWCAMHDGTLAGMTYLRDQEVVAWHRHPTEGHVESLCVIPGEEQDDLYAIVRRYVEDWDNYTELTTESDFDGDGNDSLDAWDSLNSGAVSLTAAEGISGTTCVEIEATDEMDPGIHQDISGVTPGTTLKLEIYQKESYSGQDVEWGYQVETVGGTSEIVTSGTTRSTSSWEMMYDYFEVPEDCTAIRVKGYGLDIASGATIWFDNFSVIQWNYDRRYVERLDPLYDGSGLEYASFLDSAIPYDGPLAHTFTNCNHLGGSTIYVMADGEVVTGITVYANESGNSEFYLPDGGRKVLAGLPYTSLLETMRLEVPGPIAGASQGRIKRISEVIARVYQTSDFEIGPDEDNTRTMDVDGDEYSGDLRYTYPSGYERDARVVVYQDEPYPLTLLGLNLRVELGD